MRDLIAYLRSLPPGNVADVETLERLLRDAWRDFDGWREEGMDGYKLLRRTEDMRWEPPLLRFVLERHGGTNLGSTRAELQHWVVDIKAREVRIEKRGRRQLHSMAPRVEVKPVAIELVEKILNGSDDPRLKWNKDGTVSVRRTIAFPDDGSFKITLSGRRKRLIAYVAEFLAPQRWSEVRMNTFGKH